MKTRKPISAEHAFHALLRSSSALYSLHLPSAKGVLFLVKFRLMQFYDRPRSKIALGGSSSRTRTSDQLLADARAKRAARAKKRLYHDSALLIQNLFRRHVAVTEASNLLLSPNVQSQPSPLPLLRLVAGLPTASYSNTSCRLRAVRQVVQDRKDAIMEAVERVWIALTGSGRIGEEGLVKGCLLTLAATVAQVDTSFRDKALRISACILGMMEEKDIVEFGQWGGGVLLVSALDGGNIDAQENLIDALWKGIGTIDREIAELITKQVAVGVLGIEGAIGKFSWIKRMGDGKRLLEALSREEKEGGEVIEGFRWDEGVDVDASNLKKVAITLSNVMDLGNVSLNNTQNSSWWAFVTVLSKLLHLLPNDIEFTESDDEDTVEMEDISVTHKELRDVLIKLGPTLKKIVSERNVKILLTSAVSQGRHAVIRVCQMFSYLTRREKKLNMSLQHSLAFWKVGRNESNPHILNSLWKLCIKTEDESTDSVTEFSLHPLREESAPILAVFACAYSYLLYIQDDDEMFERQWPFELDEVREICKVLKQYLYFALYVRPTSASGSQARKAAFLRKEPGLLEEVSRLLSRLYNCDSRRPFRTSDDFWLAGQGALSSDSFVSAAIEAGPEALVVAPETNAFGRVHQVGGHHAVVNGAGELLRMAPYLVPFSARARIFKSWVSAERDRANTDRYVNRHSQFLNAMPGRFVSVRRKFIFEDAFDELNFLGPQLKATIRVKFIDEHGIEEAGIDGGGVFKEFMYEVLKLGFSPFSYGLFKATPDGRLYPSPDAAFAIEGYETQFAFIGRLLGKAVFDGVLVDIPLARFFMSKILGQFNYPSDLGSLDPQLHKNIKIVKDMDADAVEDLGLNFTAANNAFGIVKEVELIKNGKNIPVTGENRVEYIHRIANFRMNTQIRKQSDAFLKGFFEVVSRDYIRLFSHEELQLLISGKTGKLDLEDLRRNTKYSGGYDVNTDVIKWFWQALSELKAEDQCKMLQFVTSSPRAPLLGFSYLEPGFCIHRAEGSDRLPTASTCMNLLKLPKYGSLNIVREKLRYALESNAGFDLS